MHRRSFLVRTLVAGLAGSRITATTVKSALAQRGNQLWQKGATDLAAMIRRREVSATEVIKAHLERIHAVNPKVNAMTLVLEESAVRAAEAADQALARGDQVGPLHGVPMTVKENIDLAGSATTNGVRALQNNVPSVDAPHVRQLRQAGAIPLARTNLPDFGLRWHSESQLWGHTVNPWNRNRTPGGSSGGDATALATGMTPLGLGNDYGGSLRWPSQCCGTAALKPTTGRVVGGNPPPSSGPVLTLQLFAVQGPMARHVRDLRLALSHMSGQDSADPGWTPSPLLSSDSAQPFKVAVSLKPAGITLHPDVESGVREAARALSAKGYVVEEVEPPDVGGVRDLWTQLVGAEVGISIMPEISSMASASAVQMLEDFLKAWPPPDYAHYQQAWRKRYSLAQRWAQFHQEYPIVLGPVCTNPPFEVGYDLKGVEAVRQIGDSMSLVVAVNCLGLPSAAIPVGVANGLPQGVQLIGARFREDQCLVAAEVIEDAIGTITPMDPV